MRRVYSPYRGWYLFIKFSQPKDVLSQRYGSRNPAVRWAKKSSKVWE